MVIGFTLVDISAEDQPMVWLSRGFERILEFTHAAFFLVDDEDASRQRVALARLRNVRQRAEFAVRVVDRGAEFVGVALVCARSDGNEGGAFVTLRASEV